MTDDDRWWLRAAKARAERGLTQREAARLCGASNQSSICALETRGAGRTTGWAARYAGMLGLGPEAAPDDVPATGPSSGPSQEADHDPVAADPSGSEAPSAPEEDDARPGPGRDPADGHIREGGGPRPDGRPWWSRARAGRLERGMSQPEAARACGAPGPIAVCQLELHGTGATTPWAARYAELMGVDRSSRPGAASAGPPPAPVDAPGDSPRPFRPILSKLQFASPSGHIVTVSCPEGMDKADLAALASYIGTTAERL